MSDLDTEPELLNMDDVTIDPVWALRVPASLALRRQVLPFASIDGSVCVAVAETGDVAALEAVERFTGQNITVTVAERDSLQRALRRIYGDGMRQSSRTFQLPGEALPAADDAVTLSNDLIRAAVVSKASDIHIQPSRECLRVCFRVDGKLEEYQKLPLSAEAGLVSRLKVMSGMDIAEKRAPQDGGFSHSSGFTADARRLDIRAATLPTKYGERMTLRLLGLNNESLTLSNLGMCDDDLKVVERILSQPHGLMLLTGPTGSGKTSTLYAALQKLIASEELNIITVEDPIEYDIPGVAQVEVDSADKVSFAKALRSVLRHDPDVVMIGEIRDIETLDIAIKASLTGHLVLSTLHTNSAVSAVTRLADMGLPRYLIGATLRLCVAQRLVRKLCRHCRKGREMTPSEANALKRPDAAGRLVYEPVGCVYCAGRGYAGRLGVFELVAPDAALSERINTGVSEEQIIAELKSRGAKFLLDDGMDKIFTGQTTVRDVMNSVETY